jgi:hypothetical protein
MRIFKTCDTLDCKDKIVMDLLGTEPGMEKQSCI